MDLFSVVLSSQNISCLSDTKGEFFPEEIGKYIQMGIMEIENEKEVN